MLNEIILQEYKLKPSIKYAVEYVTSVLDGSFPAAEPIILKNPYQLLQYMNIIDYQWKESDEVLRKTSFWKRYKYVENMYK